MFTLLLLKSIYFFYWTTKIKYISGYFFIHFLWKVIDIYKIAHEIYLINSHENYFESLQKKNL